MIFATVETIHIDDAVITVDGRLDIEKIEPIARLGYFDYTVVTDTFEMQVPNADPAEAYGLAGQPT